MTGPSDLARRAIAELRHRFGQPAIELTASGSAAIEVALEVLRIGAGDEVVVPDLGCHMVAGAVVRRAAVPVFVGVGESLTLAPEEVAAAVSPRTRAVIAVHQYGLPCDVRAVVDAVPPDITVIEDVAQTWGSRARGLVCGAGGALTVTSFGPSKPVCLGAGGALFGSPATITGAVSRGDGREGELPRPPSYARFPTPLIEQLPQAIERADRSLAARRSVVAAFVDSDLSAQFRLPPVPPESEASWTTLPLYPTGPVTTGLLRSIRASLGTIELSPQIPPSRLPIFRDYEKRIVPGTRRADPLLVTIHDRQDAIRRPVGDSADSRRGW